MKKIAILFILSGLLFSCEDVVKIDVKEGVTQLNVDALITDQIKEQHIKLALSQSYFDDSASVAATGATVIVYTNDTIPHVFVEKTKGDYVYTPAANGFLLPYTETKLYIKYGGEEYVSTEILSRVPKIDSVNYQNFTLPVAPKTGLKVGFLPEFYANDIKGMGDFYLIRSYRNDTLNFTPSDITVSTDGGFGSSAGDGLLFIRPIRQSIAKKLYANGDAVKVELMSISPFGYRYINNVVLQTNNGSIFATPSDNIPTNIFNKNPSSAKKALGAFIVSKVSTFEVIIDKNKALPMQKL